VQYRTFQTWDESSYASAVTRTISAAWPKEAASHMRSRMRQEQLANSSPCRATDTMRAPPSAATAAARRVEAVRQRPHDVRPAHRPWPKAASRYPVRSTAISRPFRSAEAQGTPYSPRQLPPRGNRALTTSSCSSAGTSFPIMAVSRGFAGEQAGYSRMNQSLSPSQSDRSAMSRDRRIAPPSPA
jgi:hypothetical protein